MRRTISSFEWRADLRPATAVAYSETGVPLPNSDNGMALIEDVLSTCRDLI